jgi:transglycosylase-like protein with SLT domain
MRMSKRAWIATGSAATVVVLAVAVILLVGGGTKQPAAAPAANLAGGPRETTGSVPGTSTTTIPPTTTTTTTAAKTTTTRKPTTKTTMPAPTPHPVDIPVPPPPHPAPVPGCAPTFVGDNAPRPDVKAALLTAAGKQYWTAASNPPMVAPPDDGSSTPPQRAVITVPPALIEAIGWQESGWQSAIKSCDGGVGTMQIMDATAAWMNQRFGTGYNHATLSGNTAIGAEYLEWLIAYFGENNFGHHYDITDPDLLTAVIVGYNAGPGAVQFANGHTVASHYATTVKALMQSQPWGN